MVNCKNWTFSTVPYGGSCLIKKFGSDIVSFGICQNACDERQPIDSEKPALFVQLNVKISTGPSKEQVEESNRKVAEFNAFARSLWDEAFTRDYAAHPLARNVLWWTEWLAKIETLGGCSCAQYAKTYIAAFKPPIFTHDQRDREGLAVAMFEYLHKWKNAVRRKQGKHEITIEAARRKYRGEPRKIIVKFNQCPGDSVVLTAAIRDLFAAHPTAFLCDVRCCAAEYIFANNPYLTEIDDDDQEAEIINLNHPGDNGRHFTETLTAALAQSLGVDIPVTALRGDLHPDEAVIASQPFDFPYWLVISGGKESCTVKKPDAAKIQAVVDALPGIKFVQIGQADGTAGGDTHRQPPLAGPNVIDLVGQTDWRQVIQLVYHCEGVLCGITALMHLAAAMGKPGVIIAGGRESPSWIKYDGLTLLSSVGKLDCCKTKGCWKDRTIPLNIPGDKYPQANQNLCVLPVIYDDRAVPKCIELIQVQDIMEAIRAIQQPQPPAVPIRLQLHP